MDEAINLISFIANDYVELSHDKIEWQRNDYRKRCRDFLEKNTMWKTMESAPKDKPILAYCIHDKDDYYIEGTDRLTVYGAHCENWKVVDDGIHIVEFGGEYSESDWESSVKFNIPDWWFVNGSDFEVVANPVAWMPIPELDIEV